MNICSLVVQVRPERIEEVVHALAAVDGAEVHARAADGRLVVTLERDNDVAAAAGLAAIQGLAGVIGASLVYQYSDD